MDGSNPIPTSIFGIERELCCELLETASCRDNKNEKIGCRDGVTCVVLYTLPSIYLVCVVKVYRDGVTYLCSPPHTAIHDISSLCGFWDCHPYIPLHFWKTFLCIVLYLSYEVC